MFCDNCGCQIPDGSHFCTVCGNKINAQSNVTVQQNVQQGANIQAANANVPEYDIMSCLCDYIKSVFNVKSGKCKLTNKRFIYYKRMNLGLWGIFALLVEPKYDFEIPITSIKSLYRGTHGLAETLNINTKDGETYTFSPGTKNVYTLENYINQLLRGEVI